VGLFIVSWKLWVEDRQQVEGLEVILGWGLIVGEGIAQGGAGLEAERCEDMGNRPECARVR